MREPWLHFWGGPKPSEEKALVGSLTTAGITPRALDAKHPAGEGIVCISALEPGLYEFLREVSRHGTDRVLAVPTPGASLTDPQAWLLLHAGASDVVRWLETSDNADIGEQIKGRLARWRAVDELTKCPAVREHLIGISSAWRSLIRTAVEIARFTTSSVLLMGESGTGKELIARMIHELDGRPTKGDLVILDCTTIVPELSGSEFFGHERGAFTGAVTARQGAFALAHGGTLFLDEVGELPPPLQAQLLRVVQEGTYKRVGGNSWEHTEFRLVCATNKNLLACVETGEFRRDLYYRIARWVFHVPPLRERCEDILPLARHFLREFLPDANPLDLDSPVQKYLIGRTYSGNVRDLRQLMSRICDRHVGPGPITVGDVPDDERLAQDAPQEDWRDGEFERAIHRALNSGAGLREIGDAAARTAIRVALHAENGNVRLAARRLGVTDRALQLRRAAGRRPDAEK